MVILSDKANAKSFAGSGTFEISGEVRAKMEEILYDLDALKINPNIKEILKGPSQEIKNEIYHFVDFDGKKALRTFKSTKINRTLALLLNIKSKSSSYYIDDKSSTIIGKNIGKDFNNLRENIPSIEAIEIYIKENPSLIETYLSTNKFMVLVPDDLKIAYVIENILDIDGASQYLQNL